MDALARIEIVLRVDISHTLGEIDPVAYLRPEVFHDSFSRDLNNGKGVTRHHEWLGRHASLINESKEEFVRHNKTKLGWAFLMGGRTTGSFAANKNPLAVSPLARFN